MKFKHFFASMLAAAVAVVACEDPNADPAPNPDVDNTGNQEELVVGDGTEANPYRLRTVADLQAINENAPMRTITYFRLENDIDMAEVENWVPINYQEPFTRVIHFDGNNKTLSNFAPESWIDNSGDEPVDTGYPGFFGVLIGSCKNLTITGAEFEEIAGTCGILAGYVGTTNLPNESSSVKNVTVKGSIETSRNKAGGMAGACYNATFEDCHAEVSIRTSSTDAGGFVGQLDALGKNSFKNCDVKATIVSTTLEKNRCGGFIGWNRSAETVIEDCHVLNGSSITDESGREEEKMTMYGGFIAFAENAYPDENNPELKPSVLTIKNSTADVTVNPGPWATINSTFLATTGYPSTITLENCSAKGSVTAERNYAGGLVARKQANSTSVLTIKGCSFDGEIAGRAGVSGLVGAIEGGSLVMTDSHAKGSITNLQNNVGGVLGLAGVPFEIIGCSFDGTISANGYAGGVVGGIGANANPCSISRSYAKGSMTVENNYSGGLVGAAQSDNQTISNCYSAMSVTQVAGKKQIGGLVGTATNPITITNCFASGDIVAGTVAAGLVGRIGGENSTVSKCIAWNSNVEALASSLSGAIIGSLEKSGTYSDCVRKSDMVLKVASAAQTLADQDNITAVSAACSYNGKAAAAGATLSSVATSLGWDTNIWDLSKDVPTLK